MKKPPTAEIRPHLVQFLTREEFKVVFAVSFLADSEDYGGFFELGAYATPGASDTMWEETFRRVIRWLHFEHGFDFAGLMPRPDGRILADKPICIPNFHFWEMLKLGQLPDPVSAIRVALEVLPERCPGFDLEVLRGALADIEDAAARVRGPEPGEMDQADAFADLALSAVGIKRTPEVTN